MCLAVDRRRGGDLVLTGSKDHYIKGFEVPDDTNGIVQQCLSLEPPHYDGIQCLVVADGDTLFSGSRDACIKKWDLERQTLLQVRDAPAGGGGMRCLPGTAGRPDPVLGDD